MTVTDGPTQFVAKVQRLAPDVVWNVESDGTIRTRDSINRTILSLAVCIALDIPHTNIPDPPYKKSYIGDLLSGSRLDPAEHDPDDPERIIRAVHYASNNIFPQPRALLEEFRMLRMRILDTLNFTTDEEEDEHYRQCEDEYYHDAMTGEYHRNA